ncbi:7-cyano-7-deazaguanine synthase [Pirellulaceae bacterium]|jgi:7-cyano-7-deazaguanine synthase|nr:7-cyano-7-deazaguanine synthase [Pirellulaceae bacterium]
MINRKFETGNLPENSTCVVSLSGGMDSTSLMLELLSSGCQVFGISFNYGQKHLLELDRLEDNLAYLRNKGLEVEHHKVDISTIGNLFHSALINPDWEVPEGFYEQENMKETVVPNRNAIFSSIAYGYALSLAGRLQREVYLGLGVHSGDHAIYPDCRPEFYNSIHDAFAMGNWDADQVKLYLPYIDGDKVTILRCAEQAIIQLGLDFETVFRNTNTSYDPDSEGKAHGRTGADVERILAFHEIGRKDPIEYVDGWDKALATALEFQSRENTP